MDQTFHFDAIHALALLAGFPEPEAFVLAYSSQYTDDSHEHKPIRVVGGQDLGVVGGRFDPVCSAHAGLGYLAGLEPSAQLKVYCAFHFVPPRPRTLGAFQWTVEPDGDLAHARVRSLVNQLVELQPGDHRAQTLIALGIALHSYADQWSHQWFSGRHHRENDAEDIVVDGLPIDPWQDILRDLTPDIGHAELRGTPDNAAVDFRFRSADGRTRGRRNPTAFSIAARSIHAELSLARAGNAREWFSFAPAVFRVLASREDVATRRASWARIAGHPAPSYSALAWRQQALTGGDLEWDRWCTPDDFLRHEYRATGAPEWFWWHEAARRHRAYVMAQIPTLP